MKATDKQVKYVLYLIGAVRRKFKQGYEYYDSHNSTVVALMNSVESCLKFHPEDFTKSQASEVIKIFKEALDGE